MTQFGQNPQQHPATRTSRNIGNFFGAEMERHLKADRLPLNARFSRSLSTPMGCRILWADRKSTRLNSSHRCISYAVFCLKKKVHYNRSQADEWAGRGKITHDGPCYRRISAFEGRILFFF